MAAFPELIAHGGTGGAVVETLLVIGVAAIFIAVWSRERRGRGERERRKRHDDDQIRPQ